MRRTANHARVVLRDASRNRREPREKRHDPTHPAHRRRAQQRQRVHRAAPGFLRVRTRKVTRASTAHRRRHQTPDHRLRPVQRPRQAAREGTRGTRVTPRADTRGDVGYQAQSAGGQVQSRRYLGFSRHRPHGSRDGLCRCQYRGQLRFPGVAALVHSPHRAKRARGAAGKRGDVIHRGRRRPRGSKSDRQRDEEQRVRSPGLDARVRVARSQGTAAQAQRRAGG